MVVRWTPTVWAISATVCSRLPSGPVAWYMRRSVEALAALDTHSAFVLDRDRIGLVDFSLPSRQPRFQLVDVAGGRIERTWLVAHGNGSDPGATGMLQHFSNVPGSNA